jgi:signal transduction histidine kinase/ActR/RegA family two-component response regulator
MTVAGAPFPGQGLRRISMAAAMIAAVLLVAAGLAVAGYNEGLFRAQAAREAQVQADILAANLTAALAFDDEAAAGQYLGALRANPEVEAASLYGPTGARLSSYRRNASQFLPLRAPAPIAPSATGQLAVTAPVVQAGVRLGSVYLRVQAEPASRRLLRYAAIGLLGVMASLVAVVLGAANTAQRRANSALADANEALRHQIEQRERAEEALRQSQKMEAMGQLTGGVAHDFNNLLMVASSGLDLLSRTDDPQRREQLRQGVRQALDRGAGLTRQLLAFSRRSPLKTEVVDLGHRIEGMRVLLERSLREDITARFDVQPGLWPVELDPAQLELALLNIAVNARDAMPNGGVITLEARNRPGLWLDDKKGDFVELMVTDTGEGMWPETARRVFEPFFTTKAVGKGTGLGLSQVYGFSRASGGAAQVTSAPGEGTSITLYFPASAKPLTQSPAPQAHPATLPPGTVLLVEDDDAVAAAVTAMLDELGYHVVRVADAASALAVLDRQAEPIDLVFSDMVMPGPMDGAALAEAVLQRRPGLPMVLTTGFSEAAQAATRMGLRLLPKPYRIQDLASELAAARTARPQDS